MIIITGGAGFIGSCLVAGLERAGAGPLVISDWLGVGEKWRNIAKRQLFDVVPPEHLLPFLEKNSRDVSMIFHMGAISSTTERDGDAIVKNNFHLSRDLWNFCAAHGKRLIYASSAATYGDGTLGFDDDDTPEHLAILQPLNLYGWSKHAFDRWVVSQQNAHQKPAQCAGLKFFNVYGPHEYHKENMRSVVHQVFPFAMKGEAFSLFKSHNRLYSDGGQLRDFIWVGDCVDIMLWLYANKGVSGLLNVGTGKARSFADLASAVYAATGKPPNITYRDMPQELRGKYQYFTEATTTKLRNAGYEKPFTSLEDGVRQYVQNYLQQDPYM